MQKVRLSFAKEGLAVYTSHLDLVRGFGRATRRAGLPVRHTQGFNPQPYLVFSPPLSLGCASVCEICDIDIGEDEVLPDIVGKLGAVLPVGIRLQSARAPVHALGLLAKAKYNIVIYMEAPPTAERLQQLETLIDSGVLAIEKKTKRGQRNFEVEPKAVHTQMEYPGANELHVSCVLPLTGESALHPRDLVAAISNATRDAFRGRTSYTRVGFFLENNEPFT